MGLDVGFQEVLAQPETFPWSNSGKNQEDIKTSNKLQPCGFREKQDTPTFLLWFPWQHQQQLYTTIALCFVCFCFFPLQEVKWTETSWRKYCSLLAGLTYIKIRDTSILTFPTAQKRALENWRTTLGQGNNVQIPPWQQWGILLRGSPLIWITWKNNKQPKQVES